MRGRKSAACLTGPSASLVWRHCSTVILAAVAVALAARRYMQRHLDACAVMRCLGITQSGLIRLHSALFVWLALLAAAVGCLAGFAVHFILVAWLAELLDLRLPLPGWLPLFQGAAVAAVLLFGFAFPPLLQLSKVPTLRVFRRELGPPRPFLLGGYALGVLALAGLLLLVSGDLRLGAYAIGGFAGALVLFWLFARLGVRAVSRLRGGGGFGWRQGLANLERHAAASTLQIVALALGLMAMLLLTVTRGELVEVWAKATPADAPNRFIVNIQPDQRQAVADALAASGIAVELAPMVRGRLMRIGDRVVRCRAVTRTTNAPSADRARIQPFLACRSAVGQPGRPGRLVRARGFGQGACFGRGRSGEDAWSQGRRRIAFHDRGPGDAGAGQQSAQAGLGFDAGQFLRPDAARRARFGTGELHHQFSSFRDASGAGADAGGALSQPDADRRQRHPGADSRR